MFLVSEAFAAVLFVVLSLISTFRCQWLCPDVGLE